jgi:hypothetical protein
MSSSRYTTRLIALLLIGGACAGAADSPATPASPTNTSESPAATSTVPTPTEPTGDSTPDSTTTSTAATPVSGALTEYLVATYGMLALRMEDQADPDVGLKALSGLEAIEAFSEEWLGLNAPPEAQEVFLEYITVWTPLLSGYQNWIANTADAGGDAVFVEISKKEFQRVLDRSARDLVRVKAKQAELAISVLRGRADDPAAAYMTEALALEVASSDSTYRLLTSLGAVGSLVDQEEVRSELAVVVDEFAAFANQWRSLDVPPEFVDLNARIADDIDTSAALYREVLTAMAADPGALDSVFGDLQAEALVSLRLAADRFKAVASVLDVGSS